jgi:hypothetical protein
MRFYAGLASTKLTLLPRSSTSSRTTDSEYLFWAELFLHREEIMPQNHAQEWSMLNSAMQEFGHCPDVIGETRFERGG